MISEKLQKAINDQIAVEMWSSNLYLSMSYFLRGKGYSGFSSWLKKRSEEELIHAQQMADYLFKRGGNAFVKGIKDVPAEWKSPLDVFESVYTHEVTISGLIDKLVDVASTDKDKASQDFLWSFVREQVEEEDMARTAVEKLKISGDGGLFYVDSYFANIK
jgi:ferritin